MTTQSTNRYLAAARLLLDNPIAGLHYMLDRISGRDSRHRLQFGEITLTIRTRSPDLQVVRACLLGEFEQAMAETDPQARFIVDAGGYIGLVSILLARRFPKARIVCLEPSSENFVIARENCAPYDNVTVLNKGLGAESGWAILRDRGTGQWGFSFTPSTDRPSAEMEGVDVISLPKLMDRFGADRIDLLKLDIEGSEYELFEVAESWIDHCQVLIVELHEGIRPGIGALYGHATASRRSLSRNGEKHLSVIS